jgi:hypothetical protein
MRIDDLDDGKMHFLNRGDVTLMLTASDRTMWHFSTRLLVGNNPVRTIVGNNELRIVSRRE